MIKAVLFDLDGVLVFTDELHFRAWSEIAAKIGVKFTREQADRCRGLSRMASLDIVLENADREFSDEEKERLAAEKNNIYLRLLEGLSPESVSPETVAALKSLKARKIKLAVASGSKNAKIILEKTRLAEYFDAVVDGNDISRSKPDPEVFCRAAKAVGEAPESCLAIDDAEAGIKSARAAGAVSVGIGNSAERGLGEYNIASLGEIVMPVCDEEYLKANVIKSK